MWRKKNKTGLHIGTEGVLILVFYVIIIKWNHNQIYFKISLLYYYYVKKKIFPFKIGIKQYDRPGTYYP